MHPRFKCTLILALPVLLFASVPASGDKAAPLLEKCVELSKAGKSSDELHDIVLRELEKPTGRAANSSQLQSALRQETHNRIRQLVRRRNIIEANAEVFQPKALSRAGVTEASLVRSIDTRRALKKIPERDRRIARLSTMGHSSAEVSKLVDLSSSAVRQIVGRRLRPALWLLRRF